MKIIKSSTIFFFILSAFSNVSVSFATPESCNLRWISSQYIKNLKVVFSQLAEKGKSPIFPKTVPLTKANASLFAFDNSVSRSHTTIIWQISIDATPDCHGTKVCNIGQLTAETKPDIELSYDALPGNKKYSKDLVKLTNGSLAYYTPFHIEAGAVNPTLEWRSGNIWYTLRWRVDAEPACQKQALISMAG